MLWQTKHRLVHDFFIGLVLIITIMLLQWWQPLWLARLEGIAYDLKLTHFSPHRPKSVANIQIIDIDEKSLKQLGRWPWPRKHLATLANKLTSQGAVVLAFDILFSESQLNPVTQVEARLKQQGINYRFDSVREELDDDALFAKQIKLTDVVLASLFLQDASLKNGAILAPKIIQPVEHTRHHLHQFTGYNATIAKLNDVAQGQGFINAIFDADGFLRRAALLVAYQGKLFPSLALETYRVYSFAESITPKWHKQSNSSLLSGIYIGAEFIATDNQAQLLIPYRKHIKAYPYTSAVDVIKGKISDNRFDGAVVFIGTSSVGMADLRATPISLVYPGVEIHASVFDALTQPTIQPLQPDWWLGANITLLLVFGIFISILLPRLSPSWMTAVAMSFIALVLLLNTLLWYFYLLHLPVITIMMLNVAIFVLSISKGFYRENIKRQQVKSMFDQYVSPAHIDRLLESPQQSAIHGEKKYLTVIFADIRDFTQISEKLPAAELTQLLNEFFSPITEVIFNNHGTIDKYVGDMVMAFWGAPLSDEQHSEHAIDAAFAMLKITSELAVSFQQKAWPNIRIGIGINSGDMNVGDMGSSFRRSYTVLGDSVNLGSRLESLTKYYGVAILVGEQTKNSAQSYRYQYIDKVKVKGKNDAVVVYQPIAKTATEQEWLKAEKFNEMFSLYQNMKFDEALVSLNQSMTQFGECLLYQRYTSRLTHLIEVPPKQPWAGTFTHQEK